MLKNFRADFPILDQEVNGRPLVYFDNAATSQTPIQVIKRMDDYYKEENANIHRGVHYLSQKSTDAYEEARRKVQHLIGAAKPEEIIFTTGTTMSINMVAQGIEPLIDQGDEILISTLEHHANIVPWQMLCERSGAVLKVIPLHKNGELDLAAFENLLNDKTKVLAISHVSNTLGTINPVKQMIAKAHAYHAYTLVDGAQATPHLKVDVQDLNCDFYVSSAHKMMGPTGIGFLYGKEDILRKMQPYQGGGEMIAEVTFEKTTYADLPHKFEAGTPNIAGGIGFGAAVDYLNEIGLDTIEKREHELLVYAREKFEKIDGLTFYGTSDHKSAVISFNIDGVHPYDAGVILDKLGIAVRTGHHCTQPLMQFYDIPGTIRASFAFYNTEEEIDQLIEGIEKAKMMLL